MSLKTIQDWCEFGKFRIYVLMGIARRKHNDELTNSTEVVYRKVLRNEGQVEGKYNGLKALVDQHDYLFRIYLTVNARDTRKAFFNFQKRLDRWAEGLVYGDEAIPKKIGRVDSHWVSEVHKPQSKDDQYFLFDFDNITQREFEDSVYSLAENTRVLLEKETPNGYHIVTEPFNYTEWDPPVEYDDMDTDGQLFVDEIS